jgi:hypothetical protein
MSRVAVTRKASVFERCAPRRRSLGLPRVLLLYWTEQVLPRFVLGGGFPMLDRFAQKTFRPKNRGPVAGLLFGKPGGDEYHDRVLVRLGHNVRNETAD